MNRVALLSALALVACTTPAARTRPDPTPAAEPPPRPAEQVIPKPVVEDGFIIEYRPQAEGRSLLEIAKPKDAQVEIYEGGKLLSRDSAPTSARVEADEWYRVHVRLPSGMEVDRKVQALHGLVASLRFTDVAPQGPAAISHEEFSRLVGALDREVGDAAKLSVLKTAAARAYFTTAMAGVLIDHLVYRENKIEAVPILKDRILDKQNAYTLYQHFTYREDKAKVQEMLEQ